MNDHERERVHLLLGAGGVRCLSYIGALEELERKFDIATVSTCSAGTFVGALYCSGMTPSEMREAALKVNLRSFAGDARWNWVGRLGTLRSWPAYYPKPGIPRVFAEILAVQGLKRDPKLGDLDPPLSTAAFDVVAGRLLVYSSEGNREMRVAELLGIATAIPFVYPPHDRQGRQLLDASVASHTPIWLATGQKEDLPIVVLRTQRGEKQGRSRRRGAAGVPAWINEIMSGAIASRDTFLLERMPKVNVIDIPVNVSFRAFDLSKEEIEEVIDAGRWAVADQFERREEPIVAAPTREDDDRAAGHAAELYGVHLDRITAGRRPTVFISYAREDKEWVTRLRSQLGALIADPNVSVWYDEYIKPSSLWAPAIEDAIRRARVGVLLLSEHFDQSKFIRKVERPRLNERLPQGRLCISIDGTKPSGTEEGLQLFGDPSGLEKVGEVAADKMLKDFAREIERTYRAAVAAP